MPDVERALISAIIRSGDLSEVLGNNIDPEHFADDECADIFDWMMEFQRRHKTAPSSRAVKQEFPKWSADFSKDPLSYHIQNFVLKAKERVAIEAVRNYMEAIDNPELLPDIELYALEMARSLTETIPAPSVQRFSAMPERMKEYDRRKTKGIRHGIDMGIPSFDSVTEGYQPTDLVVIVAYFGVGKTTLMQYLSYMAYLQGRSSEIISLEMEGEAVLRKLDTLASKVKYHALKALDLEVGDLEQWKRIAEQAHKDRHERDIIIRDDIRNCTVDKVMADMMRFKQDVIMVDYLELMSTGRNRGRSTWEGVSDNGIGLKEAARTMKTPVITAAQLNREGGKGDVTLGNVSYQSIGKHSDILIGLSQDEEREIRQEMEAIALKMRDSKKGMRPILRWELENMDIGEKGNEYHFPVRSSNGSKEHHHFRSRRQRRNRHQLEIERNKVDNGNPWKEKLERAATQDSVHRRSVEITRRNRGK